MLKLIRPALVLSGLFTLLLGLAYPLAITGVAGVLMPEQANGSRIIRNGSLVGSALIGQSFTSDRYFWSRPSATGPEPYNASASGGANLGPTSANLRDRVAGDVERLKSSGLIGSIPADAATASGSGLDPDISPDFARMQIKRVARARGMPETALAALVAQLAKGRLLGFIGEPRVNVLELNLALDDMNT